MICSNCQAENPTGARFCMSCGTALANRCPNCGTELPQEAKFCFNCGFNLVGDEATPSQAPSSIVAPEPVQSQTLLQQYIPTDLKTKLESARESGGMKGERRVVTMLFCDVKGSTAAAEQLDPEEWAEIMNGAFEQLIAPVYRYEGTLARLLGDAILAFFGAPIGHEDDPQRAVLAGLEILQAIGPYRESVQKRWGIEFDVRVGINTGLVVVGEVGSDLRLEYTALGDAVNLAARMEQTAKPGTVRITDNTQRLIAPLFDFEDLGNIEVKGKAEPVQTFRVLASKMQPGRLRGIEGLESPLVGRERELSLLRDAVGSVREGRGQIVSLMAEAGLGKSRLVAEIRHSLETEGLLGDESTSLVWHEGRCLSYQTAMPYAPFISLLRSCFGLGAEERQDEGQYIQIVASVNEVAPARVREIAPYLATLLSVQPLGEDADLVQYLTPPQMRERVFNAMKIWIQELAAQRPLVLVFEDIHWSDTTSLDLLEELMPLTDSRALMLLALFRPQRQEPSWRFHETATRDFVHRYASISLEPLTEDDSRELVRNLLRIEGLPEKVRNLILLKAEGNPFFVEEVIRSLLDSGVVVRDGEHWRATRDIDDIAVPDSLTAVLTTRLDKLDETTKETAQTASVLGREFGLEMLKSIADRPEEAEGALTDLLRRGLIREASRAAEPTYIFKHALTHETAYQSLLLSVRRRLHLIAAERLEAAYPDRVNDIARHFVEAKAPVRAVPYLVKAGDAGARAYSTPEAMWYYTQALEALEDAGNPPEARAAFEGLGGTQTFGGDIEGAMKTYQRMLEFAKQHDDLPMQVSAQNKLGFIVAIILGENEEGQQILGDAEQLARSCDDRPGLAEFHMAQCYLRTSHGEFEDAWDHLSESAKLGRELDLVEPKLFGMTHIANTLTFTARFDEAEKMARETLLIAAEDGNLAYQAELLGFVMPFYHLHLGELETARERAAEGAAIGARIGNVNAESLGAMSASLISRLLGDYEGALDWGERFLTASQNPATEYLHSGALCLLGSAYFDINGMNNEQSVALHEQALAALDKPLGTTLMSFVMAEVGFCALMIGEGHRADELFSRGLMESNAMKFLARPQLLVGSALVALGEGRLVDAIKSIEDARAMVNERAMKYYYPLIDLAQGMLHSTSKEHDEALEAFAKSEQMALEMGMRPLALRAQAGIVAELVAAGRESEAEATRERARQTMQEVVAGLSRDDVREQFMASAGKLIGA